MSTSNQRTRINSEPNIAAHVTRGVVGLVWQAIRLPVFALLVILEPVVRFLFSAVALLGVLTAFLFEFTGAAPKFPFWQTLGLSVGCVLTLAFFYPVLRVFSR